jgi:hypothetical protein
MGTAPARLSGQHDGPVTRIAPRSVRIPPSMSPEKEDT